MSEIKKLRVITKSLGMGGTENHLAQVLPKLAGSGWSIKVIYLLEDLSMVDRLAHKNISIQGLCPKGKWVNKFPFLRLLVVFFSLCKEFVKDRKSLTHFFLPQPYILGMLASIFTLNPSIKVMSRRSLNYYQNQVVGSRWVERFLHKKVDKIFINSLSISHQLRDDEGVSEKGKVKLIYNGINVGKFTKLSTKNDLRQKYNIPEDRMIMIMVANIIPYKGHIDLIEALAKVKTDLPLGWQLLCVGEDRNNYTSQLIEKTRKLGLSYNIIWLGKRTDVPELLTLSDIGILTSHQEGFSNAILEGMAAKIPMLVTDVGGNKEAVLHKETGIVVNAKSPEEISAGLLFLVKNKEIRMSYGLAGFKRVSEHFSLDACVQHYSDSYEKILCAV